MKVVYIAGPFTGKNSWEIERNVREVELLGFAVAQRGVMPLMPHANMRFFHGTMTPDFWYEGTMELLGRCDAVVLSSGWEYSKGTLEEIEEAKELEIPIFDSTNMKEWAEFIE